MTAITPVLGVMVGALGLGHALLYIAKNRGKTAKNGALSASGTLPLKTNRAISIAVPKSEFRTPEENLLTISATQKALHEKVKLAHQRLDEFAWDIENVKSMRIKGYRFLPAMEKVNQKLEELRMQTEFELKAAKQILENLQKNNSDFVNVEFFNKEVSRLSNEIASAQKLQEGTVSTDQFNAEVEKIRGEGALAADKFKAEVGKINSDFISFKESANRFIGAEQFTRDMKRVSEEVQAVKDSVNEEITGFKDFTSKEVQVMKDFASKEIQALKDSTATADLAKKIEEFSIFSKGVDSEIKSIKGQMQELSVSQRAYVSVENYTKELQQINVEIARALETAKSMEEYKKTAANIDYEFRAMKDLVTNLQLSAKGLVSVDKYNSEIQRISKDLDAVKEVSGRVGRTSLIADQTASELKELKEMLQDINGRTKDSVNYDEYRKEMENVVKEIKSLKGITKNLERIEEFREVAEADLMDLKGSVDELHKKTKDVVMVTDYRKQLNLINRDLINFQDTTKKVSKLDGFRANTEAELMAIKEIIEDIKSQAGKQSMSDEYKSELVKVNREINDLEKNLHKIIYRSTKR